VRSLFHALSRRVWKAQAIYYVVTGIMPFVSMRLFLLITGPKTDLWLVKTVGAVIAVIGGVIGAAGSRRRVTPEVQALGIGSASSLMLIDVWYAARGRISKVYLLDAVANGLLISGWIARSREPRV
jgi:hypothetical protein